MRQEGSRAATRVAVVGMDPAGLKQVQTALGAATGMPTRVVPYAAAVAEVRDLRPDIVIVGLDADVEEALRLAPRVAAEHPRAHLVALAAQADPERIRAAMRAGYRDYIVLPGDADRLREAMEQAARPPRGADDSGRVIALWGCKGGAGTTLLAVNLAAELARAQPACLLDLDFARGDVAAFLDLSPPQGVRDLLRTIARLDESILQGTTAAHPSQVHALTQPGELAPMEPPDDDAILALLATAARVYPSCVVDCGSGMDPAARTAATVADRLVLVTSADVPGIRNAWRRLQLCGRMGIEAERIRVVVNGWNRRDAPFSLADVERNLGRKVDVAIAHDKSATQATNTGRLLREVAERSPVSQDLQALVALVAEGSAARPAPAAGGWLPRFLGG